jgi:N-acetyl-anhydromuramyl-L-alanine amidase AmpD
VHGTEAVTTTQAEAVPHDVFERSMFDRRQVHAPFLRGADGKPRTYMPIPRAWDQVRGITLHQTACDMGERIERYDTIGAHFAVLRSGRVLRMADLDRVIYHGHGWNNQCVGIEINGLYAGLEGDIRTVWDDPTTPYREQPQQVTPQAMESTRQLVRWIVAEVDRHHGKVGVLGAHRQAVNSRRNDPGEAIWKQVALPLHAELGLNDGGPGFKLPGSTGYAIPEAWDERCVGIKY